MMLIAAFGGMRLSLATNFSSWVAVHFQYGRVLFFLLILLLLSVQYALAADLTTPGDYSLLGDDQQILISVSYTDDDNADNTLLIEWDEDGDDWSDPLGTTSLVHSVSPYQYAITGLQNQAMYQVRITFQDSDMADDVRTFTGIRPYNKMLHTSLSTASSKWAGDGGWGISGGKYGRFSCETCHLKETGNLSRIKTDLAVNDTGSSDQFPIEAAAGTVRFRSKQSGSADLGDDSRVPATTSTHICEACHSQTDFHRFDTTGQPGGLSHYNKSDCIKCHHHHDGFTAGCDGCHTNPPEWNSHSAHLDAERMVSGLVCGACHQGADHLNGTSEIGFDPGESRVVGASYVDADQTSRYTEAGGYAATPAYVSCQSIYCHSNGDPFDGAIAYSNQIWGAAAMACDSCHDHSGDVTTLSSNHPKHVGAIYDFSCAKCHADTVSDSSTVSDNSLHVNQVKDVAFAAGNYTAATRACDNLYCHSDGRGGAPNRAVAWSDSTATVCIDCHGDTVSAGLDGDAFKMTTDGHDVLTSTQWIREYPCEYCHFDTADDAGVIKAGGYHVNEQTDVSIDPQWNIAGRPAASYDNDNKNCLNLYCHSDGRTVTPVTTDLNWTTDVSHCDSCHGHRGDCVSCHDGTGNSELITAWPQGKEWINATPMYANTGPGTSNANSHVRHLQTNFACENCHFTTIKTDDGTCVTCHIEGQDPVGAMDENGHIDPAVHVNKVKDVVFKDGGSYDPMTKSCSDTACHSGAYEDPVWGGTVKCLACHGTTGADVDDYDAFNGTQARINLTEWATSGHGRPTASGNYPSSGNPPANFPADNPCWHCHDRTVVHEDPSNPYRLQVHTQFEQRFEKECVYCHMEGTDAECLGCHDDADSLATQIDTILAPTNHTGMTSCTAACHTDDASRHNTDSGSWTVEQKADIKNQYVMMGVCLQCHDDDDNNRCNSCHTWGGDPADDPYKIGFDPGGIGFISGSSKASSGHFGHKHWQTYLDTGKWKGGKFCWDCHDPHGDSNIYMIQSKVATETEGQFGKPVSRADVVFTKKTSGVDYAKTMAPYNGICNVCHQNVDHYLDNYGDGHRASRGCTECHEHGFGGSHASGGDCNSCHNNRPIPNHLGFGLPRDCTKCHDGAILLRMDIMRQFNGQSHHVQGIEVTNEHCYECHWEATPEGLIDNTYHLGYNYKTYTSVANSPSDLVIYGPETRPTEYTLGVTATTFDATKIGTAEERAEVAKVTEHCLGCHSDQNNDFDPFGDCKTPRQYAWDRQSIAARYEETGTTTYGKSGSMKNITKAFSAHGNAVVNQGGWSATTGEDSTIPNTRNGSQNVQCFDCHSSHGSYTTGITSSYLTFNGQQQGGNLKETQAGKGGYGATYRAQAVTSGISQVAPGAAQCFDCHETETAGALPWGYNSTFGATAPIHGYKDSARFEATSTGRQELLAYRMSNNSNWSSHFKASAESDGKLKQLCASCHDPHGVSPVLDTDMAYAVPLLKGTWMTSPYPDDQPNPTSGVGNDTFQPGNSRDVNIAANYSATDSRFAGLCLRCHPQETLTSAGTPAWKSKDRVHQSVKGWGGNRHAFTCSKCHAPHVSNMPKLMVTNCLDGKHRTNRVSGGVPTRGQGWMGAGTFPEGTNYTTTPCHATQTGTWNNQQWNNVTQW